LRLPGVIKKFIGPDAWLRQLGKGVVASAASFPVRRQIVVRPDRVRGTSVVAAHRQDMAPAMWG